MKIENDNVNYEEILKTILTSNVELSNEAYKKLIDNVAENYDKNNNEKGTRPSLKERRERIKSNYYGTSIQILVNILNTVNNFAKNYSLLIEAIAEKVGVEFEKVQSVEDKAMEAARKYLGEGALKRKAERELAEKQALNREMRRALKRKTGEDIKLDD